MSFLNAFIRSPYFSTVFAHKCVVFILFCSLPKCHSVSKINNCFLIDGYPVGVRVSGGHLREAKAPTEPTGETGYHPPALQDMREHNTIDALRPFIAHFELRIKKAVPEGTAFLSIIIMCLGEHHILDFH